MAAVALPPLCTACKKNNLEAAKQLIKFGCNVNEQDKNGSTPLHHATWWGYLEVVKLLVKNNADVNLANIRRNTPLHFAGEKRHAAIARLLLDHGALRIRNTLGQLPDLDWLELVPPDQPTTGMPPAIYIRRELAATQIPTLNIGRVEQAAARTSPLRLKKQLPSSTATGTSPPLPPMTAPSVPASRESASEDEEDDIVISLPHTSHPELYHNRAVSADLSFREVFDTVVRGAADDDTKVETLGSNASMGEKEDAAIRTPNQLGVALAVLGLQLMFPGTDSKPVDASHHAHAVKIAAESLPLRFDDFADLCSRLRASTPRSGTPRPASVGSLLAPSFPASPVQPAPPTSPSPPPAIAVVEPAAAPVAAPASPAAIVSSPPEAPAVVVQPTPVHPAPVAAPATPAPAATAPDGKDPVLNSALVFLGGVCNPTSWRQDVAMPLLAAAGIAYYNPQVADWSPELIELENDAKARATTVLFVINEQTRAVASMIEAAELIVLGRDVVLVLKDIPPGTELGGAPLAEPERKDLNRGRAYLADVAARRSLTVYSDVLAAVKAIVDKTRNERDKEVEAIERRLAAVSA